MFSVAKLTSTNISRVLRLPKHSVMICGRFLYTNEFLGLTNVHSIQEEKLTRLQRTENLQNLKNRIDASARDGILLSRDMDIISIMAIDIDDVIVFKNIIKRFVEINQDTKISLINAGKHIHNFFQLCHLLNDPDLALTLFEDETVRQVILMNGKLGSESYLLLFNLLFKNGMFVDIIKICKEIELSLLSRSFHSVSLLTLAMLALIKVDELGSYAEGNLLMERFLENQPGGLLLGGGALAQAYAWLACKEGKYTEAYEILRATKQCSNSSLKINLTLLILAHLGRTGDALFELERGGIENIVVTREVMNQLVSDVMKSRDENLLSQLQIVLSKLDDYTEITGDTIEVMLVNSVNSQESGRVKAGRVTSMDELRRKYKH